LGIFIPRFGTFYQEKSGNPAPPQKEVKADAKKRMVLTQL
jgi:hypothetical protein